MMRIAVLATAAIALSACATIPPTASAMAAVARTAIRIMSVGLALFLSLIHI